ncbi:hypothetical protein [Fusobacterium polymorphum]|uniref:Uncharacterized protein n=1 Tax=Fusobacterium nucleatum subsp. polymorphum TaxID=76857 RepID=A0A2C6BNL9_FUSNP|nr:hypothetical protein [Fusobacterium polymorphum]PHI05704.1 hypothetical protein CBG54_00820 [Fusobacterium polymorphum]
MNLNNLISKITIQDLTPAQKRSCLLSWVALNLKLRLKDYDVNKGPTAYSTRLWAVGRGEPGSRNYMKNLIKENIILNIDGADSKEEIYEILKEMADGIIEESLIICEELFAEARQAKTQKVRDKYFRAMNNLEYLRVAFIVATSNYANSLINNGIDIDHTLLTIRLGASQAYKKELNKIWKEYANGNKEQEDLDAANQKTEQIFNQFEKEYIVTDEILDKLTNEKLLYKLAGEKNIEQLVDIIVDEIRQRITHEVRLIPVTEF